MKNGEKFWCDFCETSQDDVGHIVAAPKGTCICERCVIVASRVIVDAMLRFDKVIVGGFVHAPKKKEEDK